MDLIAYANPSMYVTEPLEVFDLNFMQNLEIAKRCIAHRKRLIQYSSAEVYGKGTEGGAYAEDSSDGVFGPVHKQRWIYATAKMLLERVLYAHGVAGDLECTLIRPFNFIGSRIDYLVPANAIGGPRVFPHFISALLTRRSPAPRWTAVTCAARFSTSTMPTWPFRRFSTAARRPGIRSTTSATRRTI